MSGAKNFTFVLIQLHTFGIHINEKGIKNILTECKMYKYEKNKIY